MLASTGIMPVMTVRVAVKNVKGYYMLMRASFLGTARCVNLPSSSKMAPLAECAVKE